MRCVAYDPSYAATWESLVESSTSGTFLHSRHFLSYHGERFDDCSLMLIDSHDRPIALFPAAIVPGEPDTVASHPGITYGGIVHGRAVHGQELVDILETILGYYRSLGLRRLIYKAVPAMYHRSPAQDDLYALFRCQARLCRRDLSAAVDLTRAPPLSQRRRRGVRRARTAGLETVHGTQWLDRYWPILSQVLQSRHATCPVHSAAEIRMLASRFPSEIGFVGACSGGELLGGTVLFQTQTVCHAQYIAAGETGTKIGALDLVFESAIEHARATGRSWFDFGISTEAQGMVLNSGLHEFKIGFGAGALIYDIYEVSL